jgi:hypothetical protein
MKPTLGFKLLLYGLGIGCDGTSNFARFQVYSVSSLLCHLHLRLLVLLNSAKGRQNLSMFWGQHWVFFKGSMRADLRTVLGLKGDAFGVFKKG